VSATTGVRPTFQDTEGIDTRRETQRSQLSDTLIFGHAVHVLHESEVKFKHLTQRGIAPFGNEHRLAGENEDLVDDDL
jgi:hypothetical protein